MMIQCSFLSFVISIFLNHNEIVGDNNFRGDLPCQAKGYALPEHAWLHGDPVRHDQGLHEEEDAGAHGGAPQRQPLCPRRGPGTGRAARRIRWHKRHFGSACRSVHVESTVPDVSLQICCFCPQLPQPRRLWLTVNGCWSRQSSRPTRRRGRAWSNRTQTFSAWRDLSGSWTLTNDIMDYNYMHCLYSF